MKNTNKTPQSQNPPRFPTASNTGESENCAEFNLESVSVQSASENITISTFCHQKTKLYNRSHLTNDDDEIVTDKVTEIDKCLIARKTSSSQELFNNEFPTPSAEIDTLPTQEIVEVILF